MGSSGQHRVHGDCTQCIHQYNMFKVAIVVCLAAYAKAEAEADPALLYGAYGYAGYAAPYTYGYAGYPYAYSTLAGYGTTNGANTVGIAGVAPAAAPALAGGYAAAGRYVANSAGVVHLPRERLRLMLMLRPRLMPLSSTEPMDMLVSHTLDTLPMVLTHMPTELTHMLMELTTERDPLMPSQRPMPTTDTTDMPDLTPTDMPHMLMELTHTVMDMPGESKLFQ